MKNLNLITYITFLVAALLASYIKNPYFLALDCTMILVLNIDKNNRE